MVSPTALPNPSIIAARMPDLAAGRIIVKIISNLFAPSASEACLNSSGTAVMASSERLIIVGNTIIDKSTAPFKVLKILYWLNIFAIKGPIKTIPKNPITTEGIPANSSTNGFKMFLRKLGASSEMKIAARMPMGMEISIVKKDTNNVLFSKFSVPKYSPSQPSGFHFAEKKNSERLISFNMGKLSLTKKMNNMNRIRIDVELAILKRYFDKKF
jgi:hypothetical protein